MVKNKKNKIKANYLPISDESAFHIKIPYEYPFSMETKILRQEVDDLIKKYNKIYRATNLIIYIQKGEYQDGVKSNVEDVERLINIGNNELSRRVNESILNKSFWVALITLFVAIVSCVVTIVNS